MRFLQLSLVALILCVVINSAGMTATPPAVELLRVPNEGIQPQAVLDSDGTIHLLYYKGEAKSGNLFYVRKSKSESSFSNPLRVNSVEGSATSNGCISGGQIAVGKNSDVFVTWNASGSVEDRDHVVFFSRLVGDHRAFEAQRNLLQQPLFIDGGGSIVADSKGNVSVFWHAWTDGKSEEDGRIFIAQSKDDGKTFTAPRAVDLPARGTCACCSMKAVMDFHGAMYVLYRAADHNTKRDTVLLCSKNGGKTFESKIMKSWNGNSCPMTMFAFSSYGGDTLAAWESPGTVNIAALNSSKKFPRVEAGKSSKYPTLAVNENGDVLLSWIEKEAWNKAGQMHWQIFDPKGNLKSKLASQKGIDVWSFSAALPKSDGSFLLIY